MLIRRGAVAALVLTLSVATGAAAAPSPTPTPTWGPNHDVGAVALSGTTAYVGGSFDRVGPTTGGFARVDPVQGTPAPASPPVLGVVAAALPDGAGGWYLGGAFERVGDVPRRNLAHILADGSVDPEWAPTTDRPVRALARQGGVVYAGGAFSQVNGGPRARIAGFNARTGDVTGFAPALSGASVDELLIADGGLSGPIIVAGGSFSLTYAGVSNLAAFRTTGEPLDFAPNPDGPVTALERRPGRLTETLYVAGRFANTGGAARSGLAAFEHFSSTPTAWDPPFHAEPSALERVGSTVYVGGEDHVRGFSADAPGAPTGFAVQVPDVWWFEGIEGMTALGGDLYVGGLFFGPTPDDGRRNAAAFDLATGRLEDWEPTPSSAVAVVESDGASVALGGRFTTVGGARRQSVAQIDLLTGRPTGFAPQGLPGRWVTAAAVEGSALYVAVSFNPARVLALDAATGAPLGFDAAFEGRVDAIAVRGSTVYVAGAFKEANGVPRPHIAAFRAVDGTAGALLPVQPDVDGPVRALALSGGTLYVAGDFSHVDGTVPRRGLAALDAVTGAPTAFDAGLDGAADALAVDGSTLYVGGAFTHAAGTVERRRAAAFDTTTGALRPFAPDLGWAVTELAVADATVVAAGPGPVVAVLDPATGAATGPSPRPSGEVAALAASPEAGVVLGGRFTALGAGPAVASRFAAFATLPGAPPRPVATAGRGAATVEFGPAPSGGAPVTAYTVTASPGGRRETGAGSPITVFGLADGTSYTFTVTATTRVGTGPASPASDPVTPGAPPAVPPTAGSGAAPEAGGVVPRPGGLPATPPDAAPRVRGLRVTNRRWALARGRTPRTAAVRRGTTFVFTLSEDARTSIRIERALPGRRRGRRCVRPRRALRRGCTRFVAAVTLTRARTRAGVNRVRFTGRVGRRGLAPGRYRATVVATDGAGNRSAPRSVRFTVVRRGS